jgi:mannitol-specific phosphotransferase system IIBC component
MQDVVINYWAVLAAALANMIIGSLWYGPLFGKMWKKLQGWGPEQMKSMKMSANGAYVGGLVTALVSAYVLAHFVEALAVFDMASAWQLAFWVWLGFVATTQAGSVLWENKPVKLFLLNAANSLVTIYAMTLILALWAW